MERWIMLAVFLPNIFFLTSDGLPEYGRGVRVSKSSFLKNPFVVLWNSPTFFCNRFGITLKLSSFEIVANQKGSFRGDQVVLFYEKDLGYYPVYTDNGTAKFGGLPQLGNLSLHLQQVAVDIETMIPDPTFDGLAVIDWESWDPIYDRNGYSPKTKIYRQKSNELVRMKHPNRKWAEVKKKARRQFEKAARAFMQSTLDLVRKMRPQGLWGYYGFPRCFNYAPGQSSCRNIIMQDNDRLKWLFKASSVILPSIYIKNNLQTSSETYAYVQGIVREALRVKTRFSDPEVPVLAYATYRYFATQEFYPVIDLQNTITQIFDAGVGGVVMWDSSKSFSNRNACQQMDQYLNSILGPFIRNTTTFARACSLDNCKAHGRCISKLWKETHKEVKITNAKRNAYNLRDSIQDPMLIKRLNMASNKIMDVRENEHMISVATHRGDAEKEQTNAGIVLRKGVPAASQSFQFQNYQCDWVV